MKNVSYDLVLTIYKHYGREQQLRQTQEECAELIVAINKCFRNSNDSMSSLVEEVADVEIMLAQCKIMLQEARKIEEYRTVVNKKLRRQLARIRGQENEA
jgi:hypothetical protein